MFSVDFLNHIRRIELEEMIGFMPPGARVLEYGAGTGEQARRLAERGFEVVAIDLRSSGYTQDRVFRVVEYDGQHIPLDDASVDVIFSSNVLEHVEDLPQAFREFRRVLRPAGIGLHAMPTPAWRFWTFASGVPTALVALVSFGRDAVRSPAGMTRKAAALRNLKIFAGALLPIAHGTGREGISELWKFSPAAWRRRFMHGRFAVIEDRPIRLFHTGHMLLGPRLSFKTRRILSRYLGSAAHVFVTRLT